MRFVKTSQAKSKIKAFFKKELKEDNIRRGKEMLEKEAKIRGYVLGNLMVPKWLDVIMQRYSISSVDDLYASVGYGGFTVNQILSKLIDFYKKEERARIPVKTPGVVRSMSSGSVIVKGHDDLLVRISKCCNPVPGDDIVGFISRGRGVAIHRKNCPNLKNIEDFRLIEAHWANDNPAPFAVAMQIEARNASGLLAKVTMLISEMKLTITNMNARVDKAGNAIINLSVTVNNISEFDTLVNKIQSIPDVEKVFRSNVG